MKFLSDKTEDKKVEFRGFGPQLFNYSATIEEHLEVECIGETFPEQFMDGDSSSGEDKLLMILLPCKYECIFLHLSFHRSIYF